MKKRFAPVLQICATVLIGIGLSMGVASVKAQGPGAPSAPAKPSPTPKPPKPPKPSPTPKPPKPSPTPKPPKPTPTPKPGKCTVCDRSGNKPKEKMINCDDVAKYLQDHPGSTSGPCNVTPVTNP
jgi:outer membrane biosynthesis protein TonB